MELLQKTRFLNGNSLKLLAALFMLIDHMGLMLFPNILWLRYIGRLSMPLFAFLIAEGCRYTKNKTRHFFLVFGVGIVCQAVYTIVDPTTIYLGILLTFSISMLIIYAMEHAKQCFFSENSTNKEKFASAGLVLLLIALAYLLSYYVTIDYGFWGIMMPVFANIFDFHRIPAPDKLKKLDCLPLRILCMLIMEIMLIVTYPYPWFQFPALFAFLLLLMYTGEKGKTNLKYFFYIFYPLHLAVLPGIAYLMYMA